MYAADCCNVRNVPLDNEGLAVCMDEQADLSLFLDMFEGTFSHVGAAI